MRRLTPWLLLLLLAAGTAVQAQPVSPSPTDSYTQPGAFHLSRPNDQWAWSQDSDDPNGISIERKDAGIAIVVHWIPNKKALDSRRLAHLLVAHLMDGPAANGKHFGIPQPAPLAGQPASAFTVEHTVDQMLYKEEYTVVAHGTNGLIVAVLGENKLLERHQAEIDFVMKSISFEGAPHAAAKTGK